MCSSLLLLPLLLLHWLQMNVRSLCFARVARDQGEPWLWWEYADKMGETCKMSDKSYNPECSEKVRAAAWSNVVAQGRLYAGGCCKPASLLPQKAHGLILASIV
jgi:hypothetical protein